MQTLVLYEQRIRERQEVTASILLGMDVSDEVGREARGAGAEAKHRRHRISLLPTCNQSTGT